MAYPSYLDYIKANEPVTSAVANRTAAQLDKRTEALRDRLNNADTGQTQILYNAPLNKSTVVGSPVYWNSDAEEFDLAYSSVVFDSTRVDYIPADNAYCIGLVCSKDTDTSGNILMSGIMTLNAIENLVGEDASGRLYLGTAPGSLTCTSTNILAPIGFVLGSLSSCSDDVNVYVNINTPTVLNHSHFSVPLDTTLRTNSLLKGWRAKASTDTDVPTGTTYIYNLSADTSLSSIYPPIPLEAASVTIDWGTNTSSPGAYCLPINSTESPVKITNDGIYWISSTLTPCSTDSVTKRITLHYSRTTYENRTQSVTSLQPYTGHPLKFVNCDGDEATAGDLYAQFTLKNVQVDSTTYDGYAVRQFTDEWKTERVPTINAVYTSSSNLQLTGTRTITTTYGTAYAGLVSIDEDPFLPNTEVVPQILRLGNALEREYNGIQYVGLPSDRASYVTCKLEIPANIVTTKQLTFKLRLLLLAPVAGTFPVLTVTCKSISRPSSSSINVQSLASSTLTCTTNESVTAGTVFEVNSSTLNIQPGDTLLINISRAQTTTTYASDAGLVRINGILNLV